MKRKAAQSIADEWERAARKARAGELTQAVIIKTMAEMLERTLGETVNLQSTEDFFTSWLQTPGRKAATSARYRPILHSFLAFIAKQRARASVGSITTGEIERFRNQQIAEGKTATTGNLAVKVLPFVNVQAYSLKCVLRGTLAFAFGVARTLVLSVELREQ